MIQKKLSLNATELKIIALVSMTIDHMGYLMFPKITLFRIIGRIAYPIFAYMIAEGCSHTKNKKKYIGLVAGIGLLCSIIYYIGERDLYQSILITFSFSILIIYAIEYAMYEMQKSIRNKALAIMGILLLISAMWFLCNNPFESGFIIDYGFFGVITPVLVWFAKTAKNKLIALSLGLLIISASSGGVHIFSMLAVILLYFYNGEKGRSLGYFFYIYYLAHLAALHGITQLVYGM